MQQTATESKSNQQAVQMVCRPWSTVREDLKIIGTANKLLSTARENPSALQSGCSALMQNSDQPDSAHCACLCVDLRHLREVNLHVGRTVRIGPGVLDYVVSKGTPPVHFVV